jgi:hypothetical protein
LLLLLLLLLLLPARCFFSAANWLSAIVPMATITAWLSG